MSIFNPHEVRGQFPALTRLAKSGKTAVYFDGPGAAQMPISVNDAMTRYVFHDKANNGGVFETSVNTTNMVAGARMAIADFLGCQCNEVVFGANATTSIFQFSRAISRDWTSDDEVVVTKLEHFANFSPWTLAANDKGATVKYVGFNHSDGTYDLTEFEKAITNKTKIVAVNYACNAIGTINPIKKIVEIAHKKGALVFVDAVHYAPHRLIDVKDLDCDFLVTSVYKYFGPHVSAVYAKYEHLDNFNPYKVEPAADIIPNAWETGTPDFQAISGVRAAIGYLGSIGTTNLRTDSHCRHSLEIAFKKITAWEMELSEYFLDRIEKMKKVTLYGISDRSRLNERTPTFGITIDGMNSMDVARKLADFGIFTWSGHFYAQDVVKEYNLESQGGLVRIGFLHYNTKEEIDRLISALRHIVNLG